MMGFAVSEMLEIEILFCLVFCSWIFVCFFCYVECWALSHGLHRLLVCSWRDCSCFVAIRMSHRWTVCEWVLCVPL